MCVSISSADSRLELCGTDTRSLRCVGCNRDFFSLVFRIGFEAPNHNPPPPPLVACLVLHNSIKMLNIFTGNNWSKVGFKDG